MTYGLFDNQNQSWMGDKTGPRLYDNVSMAWFAAGRAGVHLSWKDARLVAKQYPEGQLDQMAETPNEYWLLKSNWNGLERLDE